MADDDQSIDDQADTATGGLTNDMPGLPMSAPGRGGAPSALGGIAQTFARMMGGAPPRPAPQPGRSPFQFPGQSQVPVQPGQSGPPQRWQGTTASLALPRGAPQPRAKFTPFIASPPTTSHKQWGQIEPFPNLPQSFENPGIYQGLSKFFGQNGSAAIIPLALSMGKNAGAFLEGVMQGQEWKAKMHREKMQNDAFELQQRMGEELHVYFDTVDEYESAAGAATADAVGDYAIGGVTMLEALEKKANDLGDNELLGVLGTGSVDKALKFISRRNDNWQTLAKANQKMSEQEAADQIWGGSENQGQGEGAGQGAKAEGAALARPHVTPTGRSIPTDPGKPIPAPTSQPGGGETTESGDQLPPDERSDRDKSLDGRAISLLKGYKPQGMEFGGPVEMAQVGKRMIDIKNTLSGIANNPNLKTRQQILDAVAKQVGPEAADDLAGYTDYTRGMGTSTGGSGGSGGPERDWFDLLTPLARKIKPPNPATGRGGWSQRNYNAQTHFQNDPATQTVLLRSNSLAADGQAVMDDLKELERQGRSATGLDLNQIVSMAERDPVYAKLYGDWLSYNDAYNTIVTGGRHVESGAQAQVSTAPTSYASPAAFRAAIKGHMNDVYGMLEGEHNRWLSAGGEEDDMPSYNPKTEQEIRNMRDMDWLTGTLPGQTYSYGGVTKTWRPVNSLNPHDPANWQ